MTRDTWPRLHRHTARRQETTLKEILLLLFSCLLYYGKNKLSLSQNFIAFPSCFHVFMNCLEVAYGSSEVLAASVLVAATVKQKEEQRSCQSKYCSSVESVSVSVELPSSGLMKQLISLQSDRVSCFSLILCVSIKYLTTGGGLESWLPD